MSLGLLRGLTMDTDFSHHTQRWIGIQEREIARVLRRASRDVRTAVDVGAADGMYTLWFLARSEASQVRAFEPDATCSRALSRNLELNGHAKSPRLVLRDAFVGAKVAEGWTSLDAEVGSAPGPIVVKVDIDGGEVDLLRGASTLLARRDVRWVVETHSAELETECLRIFLEAGYDARIVKNAWWRKIVPETRHGQNRWLVALRPGERA